MQTDVPCFTEQDVREMFAECEHLSPLNRAETIRRMALPGAEELVDELIADSTITIDTAAQRILKAYTAGRKAAAPVVPPVTPGTSPVPGVDREARLAALRAEWERSSELQTLHPSASRYAAYQDAVEQGRVRVFTPLAMATARPAENLGTLPERARAEWMQNIALQAEFPRVESYIAWRDADARGLVRIYGGTA